MDKFKITIEERSKCVVEVAGENTGKSDKSGKKKGKTEKKTSKHSREERG